MAESVKIEDMDVNQLKTAVNSLLQQLQNADATIRDLGAKVANKEIENSRLRSVLEASQQAMQQPVVEEEQPVMSSLENFAKDENAKSNRVAWRDKTSENKQAWEEAMLGVDKGYALSVIARWLQKEKECPLSIHTIRHQLRETHDQKS